MTKASKRSDNESYFAVNEGELLIKLPETMVHADKVKHHGMTVSFRMRSEVC